jgi:hypothetical protein
MTAMGKMILNLIHRPSKGKMDMLQLDIAHRLGLKCTNLMMSKTLFDDEIIELVKKYNREYGDEIGLSFLGIESGPIPELVKSNEFCLFLHTYENKKKIVDFLFERFYEVFNFYPSSVGCYFLDAQIVNYIKEKYPSVEVAIATCFEEGVNTFHGCNNSWYLFSEGGPWTSWIPSKANIHCPAKDESEDIGVVAIPHLNRDLLLSVNSRHDFFSSHTSNIMRGMVNDGMNYPYVFNFIDESIKQAEYNDGYSYYMIHVGAGWLGKNGCYEIPEEVLQGAYIESLEYIAELKKKGTVIDMGMTEYARWYRENKSYKAPTIGLWDDILYDSGKQAFWYIDPNHRLTIDPAQGGAIVDMRPYQGRLDCTTGPDTKNLWFGSYPHIIQTNHRAGYITHYGKGNLYNCKVSYKGEEVDLCTCRTSGSYDSIGRRFVLEPVEIEFADLTIELQTIFTFRENGEIGIERLLLNSSKPEEAVEITEYLYGCYSYTEYPADLRGVKLQLFGENTLKKEIIYSYSTEKAAIENPDAVKAVLEELNVVVSMTPENGAKEAVIEDGYLFSPVYTMLLKKDIKKGEVMKTCLKAENLK